MSEKEYIERGALLKRFAELHDGGNWLVNDYNADWIHSFIETAPAADVVEVVRCKYCKYVSDLGMSGLFCDHPDNRNPCGCRPNDFCNEGKRKEQT